MSFQKKNLFLYLLGLFLLVFFVLALLNYRGNFSYYCVFTAVFALLLYRGFSKKRIFFDTFIALYMFLGFWFKFSVMVGTNNQFYDPVGNFNYSPQAFDHALSVVICAIAGLLAASFLRERFFCYEKKSFFYPTSALCDFYHKHRKGVLISFVALVLLVSFTNAYWGIYQRGRPPQLVLPLRLGGVYTWLLTFGLSSFVAMILSFEYTKNKAPKKIIYLLMFESFVSNVSMLSRGFILNTTSLFIGFQALASKAVQGISRRSWLKISGLFIALFLVSIVGVNIIRTHVYTEQVDAPFNIKKSIKASGLEGVFITLFVQRWVGIEGVLAVSSYSKLGNDLFKEALSESFSNKGTSFYDLKIIEDSPYKNMNYSKNHFITLPGFIAFFFYPGSYVFLFFAVLGLSIFAAFLEFLAFRYAGGSFVFCALISQVVAYRLAHFGYVPGQSYLLLGTLIFNIFLFFILNIGIHKFSARKLN